MEHSQRYSPEDAAKERVYTIRSARVDEVSDMLQLFAGEVAAGRMLPRDPSQVQTRIGDWLVATNQERNVVGCVSLVHFNGELCEVRSLAVSPEARGQGLGSALVRVAIAMATSRGMHRVLALTRAPGLFEKCGFRQDVVANFPEKVWRDCAPCPFKDACDEITLVYFIKQKAASNGNGQHASHTR